MGKDPAIKVQQPGPLDIVDPRVLPAYRNQLSDLNGISPAQRLPMPQGNQF